MRTEAQVCKQMLRLRGWFVVCLAALAFASMARADAASLPHDLASKEFASVHDVGILGSAPATLTAASLFRLQRVLHAAGPSFEFPVERDSSRGRTIARTLRVTGASTPLDYTSGAAASRARDVERASLGFAAELAEARAGTLSARSTAPPPFQF